MLLLLLHCLKIPHIHLNPHLLPWCHKTPLFLNKVDSKATQYWWLSCTAPVSGARGHACSSGSVATSYLGVWAWSSHHISISLHCRSWWHLHTHSCGGCNCTHTCWHIHLARTPHCCLHSVCCPHWSTATSVSSTLPNQVSYCCTWQTRYDSLILQCHYIAMFKKPMLQK
jgi:hypothetical protein